MLSGMLFLLFSASLFLPIAAIDDRLDNEVRQDILAPPSEALFDLANMEIYRAGRYFLPEKKDGSCHTMRWTDRRTSLFFDNYSSDLLFIIHTSAGAVMCNIPNDSLGRTSHAGHLKRYEYTMFVHLQFLRQPGGKLTRELQHLNNTLFPGESESTAELEIYALQIWSPKGDKDGRVRYQPSVKQLWRDLEESLARYKITYVLPARLYAFRTNLDSVHSTSTPYWTAAVWYEPGPIPQQLDGACLAARATVFLGNARQQGGPDLSLSAPVGTMELGGPPFQQRQTIATGDRHRELKLEVGLFLNDDTIPHMELSQL